MMCSMLPPIPGQDDGVWRRDWRRIFIPAHAGAGADPFWCHLDTPHHNPHHNQIVEQPVQQTSQEMENVD
jgi:hypothetical protein